VTSVYELPPDLPVPVDDGACAHLVGMAAPDVELESSVGPVNFATYGDVVVYVYPRTGKPGVTPTESWNAIPGARGCTPQSCGFRDHAEELRAHGLKLAGLSAQTLEDQVEVSERLGIMYPVVADPELRLKDALGLPTFHFEGAELYKRVTLLIRGGRIEQVFYPVFPPDKNAEEVVAWLGS
jgi:peroxiredoxin